MTVDPAPEFGNQTMSEQPSPRNLIASVRAELDAAGEGAIEVEKIGAPRITGNRIGAEGHCSSVTPR